MVNTQASGHTQSRSHAIRGDIQGLRAIAVLFVLVFHLWPDVFPGGYVGVDVFFVISGYLIVGSLVKELERTGKISLLAFYRRRARRLMPAALLVLGLVLVATVIYLPQGRWEDTFYQIIASALYVQNWYLSWASVDYLAADGTPSPVLHYWSLSIEEQFYIFWPLIMLGIGWVLSKRRANPRSTTGFVLLALFSVSLIASLILTPASPPEAYFVSHTRFWEIALGGLLAIWLPSLQVGVWARVLLFLAGFGLIFMSGVTFGGVEFPGWRAILPTGGAALIILAGVFRVGWFSGVDTRAMRYIGDISYSLYLWHWPLIVFYGAGRDGGIGLVDGAALLLLTFVLSHLSYRYVEEWFRHRDTSISLRPIAAGLIGAFLVSGCALLLNKGLVATIPSDESSGFAPAAEYPGPAALLKGAPVPDGIPLRPAPAHVLRDTSPVYDAGCHQNQRDPEATSCVLGDPSSDFQVAVVGSSHSVNWLPTMDVLGRKNGWKIISITKSACGFRNSESSSCNAWHENVVAHLSDNPVDVVFLGESAGKVRSHEAEELIAERLQRIANLRIPIIAVRPIPHLERPPADCLPDRIELCELPRERAERANTIALAAERVANLHLVDMNDAICGPETCGPVVGNIVVFRDTHHLTATYARALAPYLEERIIAVAPRLVPVRDVRISSEDLINAPDMSGLGVTIHCSAYDPNSRPFSRTYGLKLEEGGKLRLRRGNWSSERGGYEIWDGTVRRGAVVLKGRYQEGPGGVKDVHLVGTLTDSVLVAAGSRGPRTCSLHGAVMPQ